MTINLSPSPIHSLIQNARRLQETGDLDGARRLYENALARHPGHVEVMHSLALLAARTQHWARAAALLGEVVGADPGNASVHNDLGVVLKNLKEWEPALASLDRAIALRPTFAEAFNNRGNVLRETQNWPDALTSYQRALAIKPGYPEALNNQGVVQNELGQWSAAVESFDQALAVRPRYANAWCNRGVALERQGQLDAALASYERALAIDPRLACAHFNRGNLLAERRQFSEALASYDQAIRHAGDHAEAHGGRGAVFMQMGETKAALENYATALTLNPELADTHYNRATALLLTGDYDRGWAEFEWRWKISRGPATQRPMQREPRWDGRESLAGRTVLLRSEQGLGDTLQFCRYATAVSELGARVILEVPKPLTALLATVPGVAQVVTSGEPLPAFDYHAPMMSLPLAFGTRLDSVPATVPYLRADNAKIPFWRGLLGPKTRPRVGVVWSGGFRPDQPDLWALNARRNVPLRMLAPLAAADVEFISLQKGEPAESELRELVAAGWAGPRLRDVAPLLRDFADTAALIEQLDLVISVDTSTAHLAGALGKTVWLLNRFDTCWRWMLDRTDSPWYPTLTLYRQDTPEDWQKVIVRMAQDLVHWSRNRSQTSS